MKLQVIATIDNNPMIRTNNDQTQARVAASVTENWTTQAGEPGSRKTTFTIDTRGRFAESIAQAKVGEKVFVVGDMDVRPYTNREGQFLAPVVIRPYVLRMLGAAEDEDYLGVSDIGNLGRDPEMRYLDNGDPVTNFSIAINSVSGSGESRQEHTQWVDISVFGDLAETVNNYLGKGSTVEVEGSRISARTWKAGDGTDRAGLNLTARRVKFLSRGTNGAQGGGAAGAPADAAPAYDDSDDMPWA